MPINSITSIEWKNSPKNANYQNGMKNNLKDLHKLKMPSSELPKLPKKKDKGSNGFPQEFYQSMKKKEI
jgi:hypothetical protein